MTLRHVVVRTLLGNRLRGPKVEARLRRGHIEGASIGHIRARDGDGWHGPQPDGRRLCPVFGRR